MNAKDRALECELRMMADIESGLFEASRVKGYITEDGNKCVGCALGSLAFSVGGTTDYAGKASLINEAVGTGLASVEECLQLEMGFEGTATNHMYVYAGEETNYTISNKNNPFYKLGKRLRKIALDNRI